MYLKIFISKSTGKSLEKSKPVLSASSNRNVGDPDTCATSCFFVQENTIIMKKKNAVVYFIIVFALQIFENVGQR